MADNKATGSTTTYVEDLNLIVERIFDAPREIVWEAWTNPEHVAVWWGFQGVKLPICEIDLREGGSYRFVQQIPQVGEMPFKGVYREVVKPERLVYTQIFDVEPYSIHESIVTDTLIELSGNRTKLTSITTFATEEGLQGALAGGMETGAVDSMERFAEQVRLLAADSK